MSKSFDIFGDPVIIKPKMVKKAKQTKPSLNDEIWQSYSSRMDYESTYYSEGTPKGYFNPLAVSHSSHIVKSDPKRYAKMAIYTGQWTTQFKDGKREVSQLTLGDMHQLAQCDCSRPLKVSFRGINLFVPCGHCSTCLKRHRMTWAKRLTDERETPLCVHACGATLTYDNDHIPYITKEEYDDPSLLTYFYPNKTHSYLNVHRGCSPVSLKLRENIGVLSSYDIELYQKAVRKKLENTFYYEIEKQDKRYKKYVKMVKVKRPFVFVRFFIKGEYGELDNLQEVDLKDCRTGRPHYHLIAYFYVMNQTYLDKWNAKSDSQQLSIRQQLEQILLDAWKHCEQGIDPHTGKPIYKSIQTFGGDWGQYLGKYVDKNIASQFALGAKYIPEKTWVSRSSSKLGLGPIGVSGFFANKLLLANHMSELMMCEATGQRWNPTYNENGFIKPLPKAYKRYLLELHFGVKMHKVALYIRKANLESESYMKFPRYGSNDETFVVGCPYYDNYIHTVHAYRRFDWSTAPKYPEGTTFPMEVLIPRSDFPEFSQEDIASFERYISFRDSQTNLYVDPFLSPFNQEVVAVLDTTTPTYDITYTSCNIDTKSVFTRLFGDRQKHISKAEANTKAALEYKYSHSVKNGYIKPKGTQIVVNI